MNWRHETWRKLYRREEGTFAQLSLMARGLAAELLKICDDAGEIRLGGKSLADVVCYQLGATRSDRRLVPGLLDELREEGYLIECTGAVAIKNFARAQLRKPAATEPPSSHEPAATEPPSSHEPAATEPPSSHEPAATEPPSSHEESVNAAKPINTPSVVPIRSEEFRVDKLRGEKRRSDTDSSELAEDGHSKPPAIVVSPTVLTFPCIGKGAKSWDLTEAQVQHWQELYPPLDILAEARKALAWIETNQPKTAGKGMERFLVNWFNTATNGGRGGGRAANSRGQQHLDVLSRFDFNDRRKIIDVRVGHGRAEDIQHTVTGEQEI